VAVDRRWEVAWRGGEAAGATPQPQVADEGWAGSEGGVPEEEEDHWGGPGMATASGI
jgi:hypothetical protein